MYLPYHDIYYILGNLIYTHTERERERNLINSHRRRESLKNIKLTNNFDFKKKKNKEETIYHLFHLLSSQTINKSTHIGFFILTLKKK